MRTEPSIFYRWLLGGVLLGAVSTATGVAAWRADEDNARTPKSPTAMDPAKVMGPQVCIDCHKPAVRAWQATHHATKFYKLPKNPNAKQYASAMGITDIAGQSVCAACHGMQANGTTVKGLTGVACEACHGAAGGQDGWLNPHGSYGSQGTTREQETAEHRDQRYAFVDSAGMIRPARVYLMARNCYQCHYMAGYGDVVDKGGHHSGSMAFELVSWEQGEIAHNLFLDPTVNAHAPSLWNARTGKPPAEHRRVVFVAGKLAGMEVALRNLAASTSEGIFSQAMAGHVRSYRDDLSDINAAVALPEIKKVLEEFAKTQSKLRPNNQADLTAFADLVARAGLDFEKRHDGSQLAAIDSLIPTKRMGIRYKP